MSFAKKCEQYFEKRNHQVVRLLSKIPGHYTREDYHQLRLEIKKIKALMKMAAHSIKFDEEEILKPYLKIFRGAGRVRDAHVAAQLLHKERPLKWLQEYRRDLNTEAELHEKEFFLEVNKELKHDMQKSHKKMRIVAGEIGKRNAKKYIHKEGKKVGDILLSSRASTDDMHRLRKRLKRIGYVSSLIKDDIDTEVVKVERIQEELGRWHDHCELAARLRRDAAKQPDKQKKLHMRNLEKSLSTRTKKMFVRINHSLKTIGSHN